MEQVGGLMQILESQFEKQLFNGLTVYGLLSYRIVVGVSVPDREIEYGRIRRQSSHRKLIDVTAKRATRQQLARDVVQPKPLTEIMKLFCRFHLFLLPINLRASPSQVPAAGRSCPTRSRIRCRDKCSG